MLQENVLRKQIQLGSTTIRDCPYSTSFIKHTDTSVFFNLELNCDSYEQLENMLCS